MGKGDKWLEKLNILGYEKPSAWWVEVRGIPPFARYAKDGAPGSLQPAHRDETAMNGAQLLIAHSDSSGLMNGPPAWLGFVVSTSQKRDVDHPPVHRDKAAMNGAQLLMAHGDSSGLMNGPPATRLEDPYHKKSRHFTVPSGRIMCMGKNGKGRGGNSHQRAVQRTEGEKIFTNSTTDVVANSNTSKVNKYTLSDPQAIALACLAGILEIILFFVEKTRWSIVLLLSATVVLAIFPILHFLRKKWMRIVVFGLFVIATIIFGYNRWPRKPQTAIAIPAPLPTSFGTPNSIREQGPQTPATKSKMQPRTKLQVPPTQTRMSVKPTAAQPPCPPGTAICIENGGGQINDNVFSGGVIEGGIVMKNDHNATATSGNKFNFETMAPNGLEHTLFPQLKSRLLEHAGSPSEMRDDFSWYRQKMRQKWEALGEEGKKAAAQFEGVEHQIMAVADNRDRTLVIVNSMGLVPATRPQR